MAWPATSPPSPGCSATQSGPAERGRPRLVAIPGLLLGQVIKRHSGRRLVDVTRRVVLGTSEAIAGVLSATGTGTGINTSYIERLNATFRGAMCPLVRRGRAMARGEAVLTGWMDLVGCAYNFCWEHDSLRVAAAGGVSPEVERADPGDGGGPDGPPVDDARAVESADPPAALGRPQAARATAEANCRPPSQSQHDHGSLWCYRCHGVPRGSWGSPHSTPQQTPGMPWNGRGISAHQCIRGYGFRRNPLCRNQHPHGDSNPGP